jgi:hypothetical protein
MGHHHTNAFAYERVNYSLKLAIVRGLEQHLSATLAAPLPASLARLIERLERDAIFDPF